MAEEEDGKKKEDEAPAKGGLLKNKKVLIIIIAAVVVIGGGAAFFLLKGGGDEGAGEDGGHDAKAEKHAPAKKKKDSGGHGGGDEGGGDHEGPTVHLLKPFIVNLQDQSGGRYLKLTLNLELTSPEAAGSLKVNDPKIRDSIIILLSSKSYADIGTVEGKYKLRDEIVNRINQFLPDNSVKTAYFTEFVIQ
ncbi:MAG: flagellar basal body-associated FliL family protein [Proteobacteria bacterium]|nr:flagellar basal body-associated FliL family protein [Pseudomonadota bacterium]